KDIGLVNQVTEDSREAVMNAAVEMARGIMKKGHVAITRAKMAVNVGMDTDINTGLLFERIAQTVAFSTGDRMEGTADFMEKREAVFKGR
ncbi:enoyl-CoA hydratase-related protein, partial [[Clostridium] symbiosum]|uniref:enoyl-CoA hydratase-related protein n=1 Tax=Clostridium symbiosum TaxID=1512 RepID=UPI00210AD5E3